MSAPDRYRTPDPVVARNGGLLVLSMAVTFIGLRVALHISPDSDFNVGPYNIHHLFTGVLLIAAGGIPLAVFRGSTVKLDLALLVFGAGLAMALDEWVYLVATDGTNASYLLPVSLWGGLVVTGLACLYAAALVAIRLRRKR